MKYSVIPEPVFFEIQSEEIGFTLTRLCEIEASSGTQKAEAELRCFLEEYFEAEVLGTGKETVRLSITDTGSEKEGYDITVENNTVNVTGSDADGLFYGVQSLKQLLLQGEMKLPCLKIKDYPAFSSRGFMLDCGRYFFTKEAVFHFLDMMALHKLNEFHWHLSDDQGFRCQLENQLLLTEIGSYRSHTNFNSVSHCGYYTKAEMQEIIEYAHKRCIRVIPEIDSPGHAVSMIAAYPFLSCFDRKLNVATRWGVKHDVLCIGKESTFEFMESVFDELTEIFTDGIIHLGGEEVPTTRWELCPHCQKRMKEEGLQSESDLHTYYLQRMADYLHKKGIEVRAWCGRQNKLDYSVTVQLQNSFDGETNDGRRYILSDDNFNLALPYAAADLKSTYEKASAGKGKYAGVEACLWTEFVPSMNEAVFCMYPRLGAISETAWTNEEKRDYGRFCQKLGGYYRALSFYGINPVKERVYNPNSLRKFAGRVNLKGKKLLTEGFHCYIDNYAVKRKYGKAAAQE